MKLADRIAGVIRADVRASEAYHVAPADGLLKLDAMENPYPLPVEIASEWQRRSAQCSLNRYPDPQAQELRARLHRVMGIPSEYQVLLGNGSDELLQLLVLAVAGAGHSIMAPSPGFVMYRVISEALQQRFVELPLNDDFDLDQDSVAAVRAERPALLFLASPNNPSANCLSLERMCEVIRACPGLVVVDEAYFAFTDCHHGVLLEEFDNVLIMRTLSKLGLAGLRLGFLWGRPDWVRELDKLRLPYNINSLTQVAAEIALDHFDLLRAQTAELCSQRTALMEGAAAIRGVWVYPSEANFVLLRLEGIDARRVHAQLIEQGVLVKCVDGSHPSLSGCLRVTVGSAEENRRFLDVLQQVLSAPG